MQTTMHNNHYQDFDAQAIKDEWQTSIKQDLQTINHRILIWGTIIQLILFVAPFFIKRIKKFRTAATKLKTAISK